MWGDAGDTDQKQTTAYATWAVFRSSAQATMKQAWAQSRIGRMATALWARRRTVFLTVMLGGAVVQLARAKREAYIRDFVSPDTYLVWKVYDGAIVEARRPPSVTQLLTPPAPGDETPRVMELCEILRALQNAQRDPRIRGLVADFSALHVPPAVLPQRLGLAQIEELLHALDEFNAAKREECKDDAPVSVAWSDTFTSQSAYLLASGFERVYVQPSGQIPLVGLSSTVPFVRRALAWLGIRVHAEARDAYKSMVSPFVADSLPPAQRADHAQLLGELNHSVAYAIGTRRFRDESPETATERVARLAATGPYTAEEAVEAGLVDGVRFRRDVLEELVPACATERLKTLPHYATVTNRYLERLWRDQVVHVGVVYLQGALSHASGPFSVSAAIEGLREAVADERVHSIVLRIDSGGGDVVVSETLWDAVRRVCEAGKPVIVSFGNVAASGAYYVATAADAIFADENTVTGSIGVAMLRPTLTRALFDRLGIDTESHFTGSTASSVLQALDDAQLQRLRKQIDRTYGDFIHKVAEGRGMTMEAVRHIAGGRVLTGRAAWACRDDKHMFAAKVPMFGPQAWPPRRAGAARSVWQTTEVDGAENPTIQVQRVAGPDADDIDAVAQPNEAQLPSSGRGLVDAIGGLWDASIYAMERALQSEIDALVAKHGCTPEAALALLRPACARTTTPDGVTQLAADVRLVRFPQEKPLWQRLQALDGRDSVAMSVWAWALREATRLGVASLDEAVANASVRCASAEMPAMQIS